VRLVALRIGAGVPNRPFAGVVRSVFANAAILAVADGLVTLVPDATGCLPGAIAVDVPRGLNFANLLQAGAATASRAGILRFAGSAASVDLRAALHWRSRLRDISLDFDSPATNSAWRSVAATLRADGRSNAIARLGREPILVLSDATRRLDLETARQASAQLVGLGAGGTPAGDDLLVGYLAGLWSSLAGLRARADFAAGLANTVRASAKRTNDVSRVYLEAAAACEVSERLTAVATCIAVGATTTTAADAAAAAIAVGHSSGADGACGLLLALAAWGPEPIFRESRRLIDETLPANGV
jgi:Protein of unknown function (DUF2877)